jgi:APA family basic amino acid/polyamine antiporter
MSRGMFARKPLSKLIAEAEGERRLRRVLGPLTLTALGVGAIIGTGIFVLTGVAAHDKTGPALVASFVVAGMTCVFAALCYAEFASMVPVAGSAYTYAYATLGELFAWIIGWDLVLEYAVAAATVAHGWSHYAQDIAGMFGVHLPLLFRNAPFDYDATTGALAATGAILDLPALLITALITVVLVRGIRESAALNTAMVIMKVLVVLFVIVAGAFFVKAENYHPFAPYGWGGLGVFGRVIWGEAGPGGQPRGMLAGAATIFFAYIGFDAVSVQAEEAQNPKRDVPIGILASLAICTLLYMAVSAVLTGMVRYDQMSVDAPVSHAFAAVGLAWAQFLIAVGAIAGITSVLLVMMLSQPRILMAMARDGLLPMRFFSDVHPRFRTPWKSTILTGVAVGAMASFLPLRVLAELVNIGTLLAFVIVCAAVLVIRKTHPHAERPFRAPGGAAVPILGIVSCLILMLSLPWENWVRLVVWLLVGFLIYFGYGRQHSVLGRENGGGEGSGGQG